MENHELYHYGVKGMKWGVRKAKPRWNQDGSLTKYGKKIQKRMEKSSAKRRAKADKEFHKYHNEDGSYNEKAHKRHFKELAKDVNKGERYNRRAFDVVEDNYDEYINAYARNKVADTMGYYMLEGGRKLKNLSVDKKYDFGNSEWDASDGAMDKIEKAAVDNYLGLYKDRPISKLSKSKVTAGRHFINAMRYAAEANIDSDHGYAYVPYYSQYFEDVEHSDISSDNLCHWGIKGMKWGVRRYQNKDGTRTPAGLKRYATKVKDGIAKRKAEKAEEKQRKKPLSKLTDVELQAKINRLQKEKQAFDLERSMASLNEKPISAGKSFVKTAMQKVVTPSLVDAGKDILTKYLKDRIGNKLGLNSKEIDDALSGLKQEVAELNLRKQKKEAEDYLSGKKDDTDDLAKAAKEWGYMKTIAEGKLKVRDLKNKTSEDKPKSTPKDDSHIEKLLNTKVDDLSDSDISDMDEWLKSLGSI